MKKSLLLVVSAMLLLFLLTGCSNSKNAPDKALDAQLTKVVDAYFTALKEEDRGKLQPVVFDEVYRSYTKSQIVTQRNIIGKVKSWEVDRTEPPFISTTVGQAIYKVNLTTSKQKIVMEVDLRPYMDGKYWCVYGVIVKSSKPIVQKAAPETSAPAKK